MPNQFKTVRIHAGEYVVRSQAATLQVAVSRVTYPNDGTYWIAAACWDRRLHTDPLPTKRAAVCQAHFMLQERA